MTKRIAFNNDDKQKILAKSSGKCAICGKALDIDNMTIDHCFPISQGGDNDMVNLVALCYRCNQGKSNSIISELNYKYLDIVPMSKLWVYFKSKHGDRNLLYKNIEGIQPIVYDIGSKCTINTIKTTRLPRLKPELAFSGDAEEVCRYISKESKKTGETNTRFDNVYKVINYIVDGHTYIIRNTAKEIVGYFIIIEKKDLHDVELVKDTIDFNSLADDTPIVMGCGIKERFEDQFLQFAGEYLMLLGANKLPFIAILPKRNRFIRSLEIPYKTRPYCTNTTIKFNNSNGKDSGYIVKFSNTEEYYNNAWANLQLRVSEIEG